MVFGGRGSNERFDDVQPSHYEMACEDDDTFWRGRGFTEPSFGLK